MKNAFAIMVGSHRRKQAYGVRARFRDEQQHAARPRSLKERSRPSADGEEGRDQRKGARRTGSVSALAVGRRAAPSDFSCRNAGRCWPAPPNGSSLRRDVTP